jgi:NADPH-dependent F420 reductase
MKIAVIGTGNVGGTLGNRWASLGHDVTFGVRDPAAVKVKSLLKLSDNKATAASVPDAVAASDIVVLATPWEAVGDAIAVAGDLRGKIVVDCTNPIVEGPAGLSIGQTTSAGEQVAKWAQGARVVKAFNTTGANNMAEPQFPDGKATMFICGDDWEAKDAVGSLAKELGFEVCDCGGIQVSRYLEPLAMLWIHLASRQGLGRDFAFNIIKR